ncbi:predicted protein [Sclerotinia sclerotiorum 1980 UF-70]|uniref:Uncharacterized protein n=1 Tax=Sclerotinia sclerotiorum (strain ATCC 18683 / 1980 / Ss-1) TaxID=665079 RepID=A7E5F8_SCLS1|nr:predicted protein [Sclerotinia sclerotiorum 1980 UF-70]EDN91130.1 predicted protein [Sclerotinia sclerotiorum 1980 UF-70]
MFALHHRSWIDGPYPHGDFLTAAQPVLSSPVDQLPTQVDNDSKSRITQTLNAGGNLRTAFGSIQSRSKRDEGGPVT